MQEIKIAKKITREITVSELTKEAISKWPVVTYAKGTLTDTKLSFNVNEVKGKGWRLVHDGKKAMFLFEIDNERAVTTSIYEMITGLTEKEVISEGKKLGLDSTELDKQGIIRSEKLDVFSG